MLRMSLHRIVFMLLSGLFALSLGMAAAQTGNGFLSGIPDLPLMQGLAEVPDSGVVFDKPGGRIVEAFAAGDLKSGDVAAFYDATLPQLGWRRDTAGSFLREGERLSLDIDEAPGGVTVRFTLSPQ